MTVISDLRCVLCLQIRNALTDEHIIPMALGGNYFLPDSSCDECQRLVNRSFEQKFLKGTNFVALLRAQLGLRGRRDEPIYGFNKHGENLTIPVQVGFPEVRVGFGAARIDVRPQVILIDAHSRPLSWFILPPEIHRPVQRALFEELVDSYPPETKAVALWMDGDIVPVNVWRELVDAFVAWADAKQVPALVSSAQATNPSVKFDIEHNSEAVLRGLAKIGLLYTLSIMPPASRFHEALQELRDYVLLGKVAARDMHYAGFGPVRQWSGKHPAEEILRDVQWSYMLATSRVNEADYAFVHLHNLGLYAIRLSDSAPAGLVPMTLTTYLLQKREQERHVLIENRLPADAVRAFSAAVGTHPPGLL